MKQPRITALQFSPKSDNRPAGNAAGKPRIGAKAKLPLPRLRYQPRKASAGVKGAVAKAALEALEGRQLYSASVADGVLTLQADSNTASKMVVHLTQDGQRITTSINGQEKTFDLAALRGVQVTGSDKNDVIRVSGGLSLPTTLAGGAGDDRIYGSGGNDHVDAGAGNDFVDGRGGNDAVNGGAGNDTLVGGAGNDYLNGGTGNDAVYGRQGNDSIAGGTGVDALWGGQGNDTLDGSAGADVVRGQAGKNRIVRGASTKVRSGRNDVVVSAPNAAPQVGGGTGVAVGTQSGTTPAPTHDPAVGAPTGGTDAGGGGTTTTGESGTTTTGGSGTTTTGTTTTGATGTTTTGTTTTGGSGTTTTGGTGATTTSASGTTTTGGTGTTTTSASGTTTTGGTGTTTTTASGTTTPGGTGTTTTSASGTTTTGGTGTTTTSASGTTTTGTTTTSGTGTTAIAGIGQTTGVVTADIQFIEATGMAGHAVHTNALASTLSAGDALSTTYEWDFGDPGSRFNQLVGWTAGHIYDAPGSYTVTLKVTDSAGKAATRTGTVTIAQDSRKVVYVDKNGSDANTGATPQTAVATAARAAQLITKDSRVLFHNGQTFDVMNTFVVARANVTLGGYGQGAAARLRKVAGGDGTATLTVLKAANNVVVEDLVIDSQWDMATYGPKQVPARGIGVYGDNFSVRDCEFYNVDDAINTEGRPTGVMVQDCYFGTSIRSNCIWGEGFDHVYVGNTFTNSTQEHLIRCADTGVTRLLIENNSFYRPGNEKGSIELRTSQWFYVRGNRIDGGTLRMGLPNGLLAPQDQVQWGVVEGNETFRIFVNFRPGASHISFRDNVVHYDEGLFINLETKYAAGHRLTQDIRIDHNTLISNSKKANFLQLDGPAKDISVTNNLMVAPNLLWVGTEAGAVYVAGTDLGSFSRIDDNLYPAIPTTSIQPGTNYLAPAYGDIKLGYIPDDKWAAQPKVGDEEYKNVDLSGDTYDVTIDGVTYGAKPEVFDPNAYKLAVKKAA